MLLPYWDRSGNMHELEPPPPSYHDWLQGEDVLESHLALHQGVREQLGMNVVQTACRSDFMNITLDATLNDGTSVILRQRHRYPSDPAKEEWSRQKFENERSLLQWLRDHTRIPVPSILASGPDYTIQEKLGGSTVAYRWHRLSPAAKDMFISAYVDVLWDLFCQKVPQQIGSASFNEIQGKALLNVNPLLAANPAYSSLESFGNMVQYFHFLFTVKCGSIRNMEPQSVQRAKDTLSFMEERVMSIAEEIDDPTLLRCVLTHADLHGHNILVDDDGNITGVLDWEFNYVQPAALAIDYPLWLSTQGHLDPQFASDCQWWEESPDERRRLCILFEEKIRERSLDLHKCFTQGRILRAAAGWLLNTLPDPGLNRMGAWAKSSFEILR